MIKRVLHVKELKKMLVFYYLSKFIESSVIFLNVMFFQVCNCVFVLQSFEWPLWRLKVLSEKKNYIFSQVINYKCNTFMEVNYW